MTQKNKQFLVKIREIKDSWFLVDSEDAESAKMLAGNLHLQGKAPYHHHFTKEIIVNPSRMPKKIRVLLPAKQQKEAPS